MLREGLHGKHFLEEIVRLIHGYGHQQRQGRRASYSLTPRMPTAADAELLIISTVLQTPSEAVHVLLQKDQLHSYSRLKTMIQEAAVVVLSVRSRWLLDLRWGQ